MRLTKSCFYLLPLLLFVCGGCADSERAPAPHEREANRPPAPDFSLSDNYGNRYSPAQFRGKVVLLNFWAPWCFNCVEEMKALKELQEYLPADKFQVLAVTVLDSEHKEVSAKFGFPVLLDESKKVATQYHVNLLPVTVILDKDGRIAQFPDPDGGEPSAFFEGPRGWNSLKVVRDFERLIAE